MKAGKADHEHHKANALDDYTKVAIGAVTKNLNTNPDKEKPTC